MRNPLPQWSRRPGERCAVEHMQEKEIRRRTASMNACCIERPFRIPARSARSKVSHDGGARSQPLDDRSQARDPDTRSSCQTVARPGTVSYRDPASPGVPGAAIPLVLEVRDGGEIIAGVSARQRRDTVDRLRRHDPGQAARPIEAVENAVRPQWAMVDRPVSSSRMDSVAAARSSRQLTYRASPAARRRPPPRAPRCRTPPCRKEGQAATAAAVHPTRRVLPLAT